MPIGWFIKRTATSVKLKSPRRPTAKTKQKQRPNTRQSCRCRRLDNPPRQYRNPSQVSATQRAPGNNETTDAKHQRQFRHRRCHRGCFLRNPRHGAMQSRPPRIGKMVGDKTVIVFLKTADSDKKTHQLQLSQKSPLVAPGCLFGCHKADAKGHEPGISVSATIGFFYKEIDGANWWISDIIKALRYT